MPVAKVKNKKKGKAGAPKRNTNAVGHGRKPNEGFSKIEVLALGEELVKWMKEIDEDKSANVVHLSEWYSYKKNITNKEWDALRHRDCFLRYYEKAINWMGVRMLKNKELSPTYGSRFVNIYFRDAREAERDKAQFEASLKAMEEKAVSPEATQAFKELFQSIIAAKGSNA